MKYEREGSPRRNVSSDRLSTTQICLLKIQGDLQGSSSDRDVSHERTSRMRARKYLKESCCHCIYCLVANFLASFMWRRPLNSVALATTTNRRPEGMSDGIGTRVVAQIINRCRIEIILRDLYNVRGPPLIRGMGK